MKKNIINSSGGALPNFELTCFWLMGEDFHLQSVVLYRKSSYHEYELQPTVVPSVGAQCCEINDAFVSHQTLVLGEQTFRFSASFVGGGLPV